MDGAALGPDRTLAVRGRNGRGELRSVVPDVSLEVFEAHERHNRTYRAVPVRKVFDSVFGKSWRQAQEIVFTSIDGFQPSLPVEKFLAHEGYLALAHVDGTPFTVKDISSHLQSKNIETRPIIAGNMARHPALKMFEHRVHGTLANCDHIHSVASGRARTHCTSTGAASVRS